MHSQVVRELNHSQVVPELDCQSVHNQLQPYLDFYASFEVVQQLAPLDLALVHPRRLSSVTLVNAAQRLWVAW